MNELAAFLKGLGVFIIYYIVESLIFAGAALFMWRLGLNLVFDLQLGYIDWFTAIFIVKLFRLNTIDYGKPPEKIIVQEPLKGNEDGI